MVVVAAMCDLLLTVIWPFVSIYAGYPSLLFHVDRRSQGVNLTLTRGTAREHRSSGRGHHGSLRSLCCCQPIFSQSTHAMAQQSQ